MKPFSTVRVRHAKLLVLLITTLVITGCVSSLATNTPTPTQSKNATSASAAQTAPSDTSQTKYELIDAKCDEKQCLFRGGGDDHPISLGLVTLKGYYQQLEVEMDNRQKINCDYFVVSEGAMEFQREFLALIDFGNTVNRRNESGQLVMGISLKALEPSEQDKVLGSTNERPVSLVVLSPTPPASMGDYCLTFVNILQVKQP